MSSILTVSQLNKYVAFKLKSDIKLKGVSIKGEISNFTLNYKSGHAYFTVKDDQSCIKAVMFSSSFSRVKTEISDGMSVLVTGNVELYEAGGSYQIIVTDITPLGAGLLYKQIEVVKDKLAKRGVFDDSIKKPVPIYPRKIAVVSSLTGAALQDILNIIGRRFPVCTVGLFHTQVQGEGAVENICNSIASADSGEFDTIILSRGGGSLEDLMPFNSEAVALAVYNCSTPIISAVGHETDTTLVDYAADLRAPTPSAAAELATPNREELIGAVDLLNNSLSRAFDRKLAEYNTMVESLTSQLRLCSPQKALEKNEQRLEELSGKLTFLIGSIITKKESFLEKNAGTLNALSPFNVLSRGYAIVSKDNVVVRSFNDISENDRVKLRFRDDTVYATLNNISRKEE